MANLIPRRKSKKQKALRAVSNTGKKAVKAKMVLSVAKGGRRGAGKAAKTGVVLMALSKARRPFMALGAVAGGALVAKRLTSGGGSEPSPPATA